MTRRAWAPLVALAYVLTVVAANVAVQQIGAVPVGFGLVAPAGVYFAGLAFTLRDVLHELSSATAVVVAVAFGTLLSYGLGVGRIATASALAWMLSELVDLAVYSPLRRRGWLLAVAASNVAGLLVDSLLFVGVAFGSFAFLPGQIVGKLTTTLAAVVLLAVVRRARRA